jgi:GNAT superfamily N-acetyltransferase
MDPSQLIIERLHPGDVPENVALSRAVGWKDVESEWRVLHQAGDVRGVRLAGRLAAQGVLGDFGAAASLAKMVVAPELQQRGLGARLLDALLAMADDKQQPVGLCATDQGQPLYERRGFAVSGELSILVGEPASGMLHPGSVVSLDDAQPVVACDRRFSGCDRGRMLRARFNESSLRFALSGARHGVALASQQGDMLLIGPILAETEDDARQLAAAVFATAPGPVRIDVPFEHAGFRRWLVELGLREASRRVEMVRGARRSPWQVPERFALSTQAWG